MKRLILPLLLVLLGIGGGIGAGLFLRPAPDPETAGAAHDAAAPAEDPHADLEHAPEYVKLNNQFIIPLVENGRVSSMVVLSLSLEVAPGTTEAVFAKEPKLRDSFLQILFDHANTGGFRGAFTDGAQLSSLRKALLETAQKAMPDTITDVLITDIARQDS
ncbi:Flagellar basal body-associated protein FliL [Gemmobacter aquatilis]|uniref:Flagellar protein FliL n=1 Tax=Gemmobacter aquatilis TaxID=933059 RepID=A0A1H7YLH2_9RHOB|nr:flagellar basal body-associated FliL family protein [Gemmobacter aquatilis]SEM46781.1 Flagellar basal body-associated protein FliL [Gemmobacter aquatilis]